jgi:hypothetical protein
VGRQRVLLHGVLASRAGAGLGGLRVVADLAGPLRGDDDARRQWADHGRGWVQRQHGRGEPPVFRNGTQTWPASGSQNVPNGGPFAFPSTQVGVNAGDDIEFVTSDAGSTNYCDGTTWDPSVSGGVPAA